MPLPEVPTLLKVLILRGPDGAQPYLQGLRERLRPAPVEPPKSAFGRLLAFFTDRMRASDLKDAQAEAAETLLHACSDHRDKRAEWIANSLGDLLPSPLLMQALRTCAFGGLMNTSSALIALLPTPGKSELLRECDSLAKKNGHPQLAQSFRQQALAVDEREALGDIPQGARSPQARRAGL